MAESLSQLLEDVKRGQEAAVAALVRRFGPSGRRLAEALLSNSHDAEEAVQVAFVAALARMGELRSSEAFPTWFRQIVRTCAGRISRRRRPESDERALDAVAGREPPPDDAMQLEEVRQIVRRAIAQLQCAQRETAELFYLDERSVSDVAAALNLPVGTVKRRLHIARARLRNLLLGSKQIPEGQMRPRTDQEI